MLSTELSNGCTCRQLSKSGDDQYLVTNGGEGDVKIYSLIYKRSRVRLDLKIAIPALSKGILRAFSLVRAKNLILVTSEGVVHLLRLDLQGNRYYLLRSIQLDIDENEEVSCVATDTIYWRFISIACSINLKATKIVSFKLETSSRGDLLLKDCFETPFQKQHVCENENDYPGNRILGWKGQKIVHSSSNQMGFLQDMKFVHSSEEDDSAILTAFQYDASNLMLCFKIDQFGCNHIIKPRVYHSNYFFKANFYLLEKTLWTIDKTGIIKSLRLKQE